MNTQRLEKVLKKMETEGLEQMIISDPYAIYYLTGRFIDPGERLLALYINQSGKNKIFINNLFTVPEDLGVEKFRCATVLRQANRSVLIKHLLPVS